MISPRIDLTHQDIADGVANLQMRVRLDALLGPVFATHAEDWSQHEKKNNQFWASTSSFDASFQGNLMATQMRARNVHPKHFKNWLKLIDEALWARINAPHDQWSALAPRVGRSLPFASEAARNATHQYEKTRRQRPRTYQTRFEADF